jgi:hypothetical protein
VRFGGRWYCAFREGTEHATEDGKGRILVSDDGAQWISTGLLEAVGDLRDPKLCVTPDGRLIVAGRSYGERQQTQLWWLDPTTGRLDPILTLPSGKASA